MYISKKWFFGVIGALVILFLIGYGVYNTIDNKEAVEIVKRFIKAQNEGNISELRATFFKEEMVQNVIRNTQGRRHNPYFNQQITAGPWVISKAQVGKELGRKKPETVTQFFAQGEAEIYKTKYIKVKVITTGSGQAYYNYFILVKPGDEWKVSNMDFLTIGIHIPE